MRWRAARPAPAAARAARRPAAAAASASSCSATRRCGPPGLLLPLDSCCTRGSLAAPTSHHRLLHNAPGSPLPVLPAPPLTAAPPAPPNLLPRQGDTFAERLGFPAVLDELLPRITHCCWQDSWAARLGGAAGVRLLAFKLPASYLRYVSPQLVRALLTVSKWLPGGWPRAPSHCRCRCCR